MAATIAANNDAPAPQTFTLHIISPSLGSHGPFSFPNLPTATTVQELKAKIRERVQTKPHNDHQRLIHRGRQLTEVETMADIFGQETVRILVYYSFIFMLTCILAEQRRFAVVTFSLTSTSARPSTLRSNSPTTHNSTEQSATVTISASSD